MAKVHVRVARKDYPESGIKKGDKYNFAQIKTGPRSSRIIRSIAPIPRWQLTSSEFFREIYQWEDRQGNMKSMDDLEDLISDLRQIGEDAQGRYDNMPEGLQQGDTGQTLETRAQACESAADELDGIMSEWNDREEVVSDDDDLQDFLDRVAQVSVDY